MPGGSRSRIAVPILPPNCRRDRPSQAGAPSAPSSWTCRSFGDGDERSVLAGYRAFATEQLDIPETSTPAVLALTIVQCGSGCVNGTPGANTRAAKRPLCNLQILHAKTGVCGRLPTSRCIVRGNYGTAPRSKRATRGKPGTPKAEDGDCPTRESRDGSHVGSLSRVAFRARHGKRAASCRIRSLAGSRTCVDEAGEAMQSRQSGGALQ